MRNENLSLKKWIFQKLFENPLKKGDTSIKCVILFAVC